MNYKKLYIIGLLFMSCLLLSGCTKKNTTTTSASTSTTTDNSQVVTIFALGDSLTAGYQLPVEDSRPSQLERKLQALYDKKYKVVNGGKSGDTSKQLKDRLSWTIADAKQGDIAIITIGANDAFQGVDIATLENNIKSIIQELQNKGIRTVIGGMQITTNLGSSYTSAFKKMYPRIAKETKSELIPFILEGVALRPEYNLSDMIHPNAQGYTIVTETVYNELKNSNIIP